MTAAAKQALASLPAHVDIDKHAGIYAVLCTACNRYRVFGSKEKAEEEAEKHRECAAVTAA